jgi:hypothetical protein
MYIIDQHAITPQHTVDNAFDQGAWVEITNNIYTAIEPAYQSFIPLGLLRRMGKAVRMGIGTALPLIERNEKVDGIIIGTANGGLEDCIKFLNQIVEYEEGILTPTNFVQSTPNALAGQIALMQENQGYNMTHVNGSLAFESALLDASLFFEETNTRKTLLLGAIEEVSNYNYNIDSLGGRFKDELVSNNELIQTNTPGSYCGEGSVQFIVSNRSENALSQLVDAAQCSALEQTELEGFILDFLAKNNLTLDAIDLLLLGKNGDSRHDFWYDNAHALFGEKPHLYFKKAVGEYRTVTAFAVYVATKILNNSCTHLIEGKSSKPIKNILIYNHFDAVRHSLLLVSKCVD